MKKLLILFTVLLFAIGAGYAQNDPTILISWDDDLCDCTTSSVNDYFKVSFSVTVWFYEASPDPDVLCCSGFESDPADCRDFEAGDQFDLTEVPLN